MSEIKELTDKLKNGKNNISVKKDTVKKPVVKEVNNLFFNELRTELKERNYNNKATTYLDVEISEALSFFKTRGKIPIGSLVSYILEDWIKKHQEEIKSLSANKYI